MLVKSLTGYALAILVGVVAYVAVSRLVEKHFMDTNAAKPPLRWVVLQWVATAFLWSQWLVQDLANIFVYLPRTIGIELLIFSIAVMLLLHGLIFYQRGGRIQSIVTSKTNTTDIRSATIIDFIYAFILLYFKQVSNIPMSTTWVFLGLLAGRELALTFLLAHRPIRETLGIVAQDAGKAVAGLLVSIGLAIGLPNLARVVDGRPEAVATTDTAPRPAALRPDRDGRR